MSLVRLIACASITLTVAGCATAPTGDKPSAKTAYFPMANPRSPASASDTIPLEPASWLHPNRPGGLAGRTLTVSSIGQIKLAPKEVILTFDDGPRPGRTEQVLAALDRYGVKATFLMVGEMAKAHPALALEVAAHGNSIGSHTYRHANLKDMNYDLALSDILRGETAVKSSSGADIGFFRFPYLADTSRLRASLSQRGTVVLDVGIDSKDYFKSTPSEVIERTMAALHHRQSGIILMHDIHARTVKMLPELLSRLQAEGYKVVTLRYKRSRMPMVGNV
ncbi:MAG: polysaccharide deacetylase family protein [Allorhizobium sp.]